jgi:octaprenyl-diphosphate synthase
VKNHHKNDKKVADLIVLVKNTGGLKYAYEIMKNYQKEALAILSEFPNSDAKNSLKLLVDYVINREK